MGRKWAGGGRLPLSGPVDFEVKPGSLSRNAQRTGGDPEQGLGSQLKTRTLKEGLEDIGGKEPATCSHSRLVLRRSLQPGREKIPRPSGG